MLRPLHAVWFAAFLVSACSTPREPVPQEPLPAATDHTETLRVFHLQHANAQEVASILTELVDASKRAASTRYTGFCALMTPEFWEEQKNRPKDLPPRGEWTRIVAEPVTNSVTIIASSEDADDIDRLAELIERLDVEIPEGH